MTPERQQKIDLIHTRANRVFEISIGTLLILGITLILKPLLAKLGLNIVEYSWYAILAAIYEYTAIVLGIIAVIAFCITAFMSFWATDDEEEQKKKLIKEAVREMAEETEQSVPTIVPTQEVYDPFAENITDEQKDTIKQILRDLPSHREKRDCINMSEVSRYLTALVDLKIISSSKSGDVNSLRTWVEQVTGKQAPEQYRFNDAFPSTYKTGIDKAKKSLKQALKI